MKVRILKVSPKVYILQEFSNRYKKGGEWLGLEVVYNFLGLPSSGIQRLSHWSMGSTQYRRCSYASEGGAMKALKALKKHHKKDGEKEALYRTIERGLGEVVYEEYI